MRILQFPTEFSVGKLLIGEKYDGTDWNEAIEAQGTIEVPENKYVSFWLGARLSVTTDLYFLKPIKPNDFDEFLAASSWFSDKDIEKILYLSGLDSLQIWETEITDETLKKLSNFKKLRVLGIDSTQVTDDGLCYLSEITSLERLSVYSTEINGSCFPQLTKLNLKQLDIGWTNVGDDSIQFLKQMKSLKYLRIIDTKITESGFLELEENLPDCRIYFHKSNK
ncbi:MAG TPA: hypothetical protein PKY59_07100 [Pyrinomonadaceae bacterium]|nr:hypothetical protein [Pyrinomonadaceae bacterium]